MNSVSDQKRENWLNLNSRNGTAFDIPSAKSKQWITLSAMLSVFTVYYPCDAWMPITITRANQNQRFGVDNKRFEPPLRIAITFPVALREQCKCLNFGVRRRSWRSPYAQYPSQIDVECECVCACINGETDVVHSIRGSCTTNTLQNTLHSLAVGSSIIIQLWIVRCSATLYNYTG